MTDYDDARTAIGKAEEANSRTVADLSTTREQLGVVTEDRDQWRKTYEDHMATVHPTEPPPPTGGWSLPLLSADMIIQLYAPNVTGLGAKAAAGMKNTNRMMTGFGTRIPAKYPVEQLMGDSLAIAVKEGIRYRPRTMMGGHISDEAKASMAAKFLFDGDGVMAGIKCPRPTDGAGNPNTVFLQYFREHVRMVFKWCKAHGVDLFNVPTVGMAYSELYYGTQVQNDPAGWLAVHKMLVDIVAEEQALYGVGVSAGWGLSGHGPFYQARITSGGSTQVVDMGMELAKYIKAKMPEADRAEAQGNGWGPNGIWGQSNVTVERQMDHYLNDNRLVPGAQAIQPWRTGATQPNMAMLSTADFQKAYGNLARIDCRQLEVYLDTPATDTEKRMLAPLTAYLSPAA